MVIPQSVFPRRPRMQRRRDATAVVAGRFDPLPERDVLTSCLNHIGPYYVVEKTEEERQRKKMEKRQKDRDRKRKQREEARAADKRFLDLAGPAVHASSASNAAGPSSLTQQSTASSSSKHITRPTIHIPAMQRSFSITPSPPSSPQFINSCSRESTPGPSVSSSTSRTSSKRPHTPDDDEALTLRPPTQPHLRPRKKRVAVKKGWKGWVEGSPPPSAKLINLDSVPILRDRRTRSGKNFDAIGVGKDSWV